MSAEELILKVVKLTREMREAAASKEQYAIALLDRDRILAMHRAGK